MNAVTLLQRTPNGYRVAAEFLDPKEANQFVDEQHVSDKSAVFEAVQGPADYWSEFIAYDPETPSCCDFTPDETLYYKVPDGSWRSGKFIAMRADHGVALIGAAGPSVVPFDIVSRSPSNDELRYDEAKADDWGEPIVPVKEIKTKVKKSA